MHAQSIANSLRPMPRYLDAATAAKIDERLMGDEYGFTLEQVRGQTPLTTLLLERRSRCRCGIRRLRAGSLAQLMELAGLACAMTVQRCFPPATHPRVLIAAGPGNQGGDGLVAARHLCLFGYAPTLYYPKGEDKTAHYGKLWRQASHAGVERIDTFDESALADADVCLDVIFGFSFKGAPRPPFDDVLAAFKRTKTPIVSVDIPSGARRYEAALTSQDGTWTTATRATSSRQVRAARTRPLTEQTSSSRSPPRSAAWQRSRVRSAEVLAPTSAGRHFLGGRFVPPSLAKELDLCVGPSFAVLTTQQPARVPRRGPDRRAVIVLTLVHVTAYTGASR